MPPHIVRYPPIQCNTRERCDQLQISAAPPAWRVPEGPDNLAAAPMGGDGAWPGFEATHNRASAAGVEGAGGTAGPDCGTRGRHRHHRQINVACNSPRHESPQAQKPQNINDQNPNPDMRSRELHAKLRVDSHRWASGQCADRSSRCGRVAGRPRAHQAARPHGRARCPAPFDVRRRPASPSAYLRW